MELLVEICDSPYRYDLLLLKQDEISREDLRTKRRKIGRKLKRLDSYLLHYLVKEFQLSRVYRVAFLKTFYEVANANDRLLKFVLLPTRKDLIDYNW